MKILIQAGKVRLQGQMDVEGSVTARRVGEALPVEGVARRWGDEIYFKIPVDASLEHDAVEVVEVGDVAYWPTGKALCLFFGPTPVSGEGEVRAASPVNVIGRMEGDPTELRHVADGDPVRIENAE